MLRLTGSSSAGLSGSRPPASVGELVLPGPLRGCCPPGARDWGPKRHLWGLPVHVRRACQHRLSHDSAGEMHAQDYQLKRSGEQGSVWELLSSHAGNSYKC